MSNTDEVKGTEDVILTCELLSDVELKTCILETEIAKIDLILNEPTKWWKKNMYDHEDLSERVEIYSNLLETIEDESDDGESGAS